MATTKHDSRGNAYYPNSPPMRKPGLTFLYRLECTIAREEITIGAPHGTGVIRSIANITGGTFKGQILKELFFLLVVQTGRQLLRERMYASNLYTIYLFPFHFRNCYGYRRVTNSIVHDSRRPIHNKNNRRVLPLRTSPRSVPPRTRNRIREAGVQEPRHETAADSYTGRGRVLLASAN